MYPKLQPSLFAAEPPLPSHILDLLPGLVAYFDLGLHYRFANAAYSSWRGLEPDKIIGHHVRDIVGENNYPVIAEKLHRAAAGERITYEYDLFDGGYQRRVQGSYAPDLNAQGEVVGIVALVTDISTRHDLQSQIARSEAMFNEAFENAPIGAAMVDLDGRLIRANAAFSVMLGHSAAEMRGLNIRDITHPDDIEADLELLRSVLRKERDGYCMEKRYLRRDGSDLHGKLAVSVVRNDAGDAIRFFAHVEDVSQQREAERRLIATNARLSLVTEAIRGGSWHMDVASSSFQTSEALAQFVAGPDAQPMDLDSYSACIHAEDRDASDLQPLLAGRCDRASAEYRLETSSGTHWIRCDRRLLRDGDGRPEQIVGVAIDMTDEHQRRMLAETQAITDPLTGLLNRRGLEQRLSGLARETPCGVLAVDLDRFKQVNDQFGHDAGDAALVEAAARLRGMTRASDLVARVGGDEFVLVLIGLDLPALTSLAERAIQRLQEPFDACAGRDLRVGASIGAIWSPEPPKAIEATLSRADGALYQAKAAGRGTWRLAA